MQTRRGRHSAAVAIGKPIVFAANDRPSVFQIIHGRSNTYDRLDPPGPAGARISADYFSRIGARSHHFAL
jgi:hypothetical protein